MKLSNESLTLFIPLYSKALMSKENIFLNDKKAEEIIDKIDYDFSKLKHTKWLSMYMATRSLIIDNICNDKISNNNNLIIIHLGCGLDSRALRVSQEYKKWYDIDLEEVISLRKKYYNETEKYKMIGKSVLDFKWLDEVNFENSKILIIAEGLTMYLAKEEIQTLLKECQKKFKEFTFVFDAYSNKARQLSKYKNPVNQMNAKIKWGMDIPDEFINMSENVSFVKSYLIKHKETKLNFLERLIFENLYCGKFSQKLYKIYEFEIKEAFII